MRDYPDCPDCETDVFVAGRYGTQNDFQCHFCGTVFDQRGRRSLVDRITDEEGMA